MTEYLEVMDETGQARSLKVENPIFHDGFMYFDSSDEEGHITNWRVKIDGKKESE